MPASLAVMHLFFYIFHYLSSHQAVMISHIHLWCVRILGTEKAKMVLQARNVSQSTRQNIKTLKLLNCKSIHSTFVFCLGSSVQMLEFIFIHIRRILRGSKNIFAPTAQVFKFCFSNVCFFSSIFCLVHLNKSTCKEFLLQYRYFSCNNRVLFQWPGR